MITKKKASEISEAFFIANLSIIKYLLYAKISWAK